MDPVETMDIGLHFRGEFVRTGPNSYYLGEGNEEMLEIERGNFCYRN
jgi:hypothetical protein